MYFKKYYNYPTIFYNFLYIFILYFLPKKLIYIFFSCFSHEHLGNPLHLFAANRARTTIYANRAILADAKMVAGYAHVALLGIHADPKLR